MTYPYHIVSSILHASRYTCMSRLIPGIHTDLHIFIIYLCFFVFHDPVSTGRCSILRVLRWANRDEERQERGKIKGTWRRKDCCRTTPLLRAHGCWIYPGSRYFFFVSPVFKRAQSGQLLFIYSKSQTAVDFLSTIDHAYAKFVLIIEVCNGHTENLCYLC